jgi:hypothetical protein
VLKQKKRRALSPEIKKEAAGIYAKAVAKYVPHDSGQLLESAKVIKYNGEYAVEYSAFNKRGKKHYDYADFQYRPEKYGRDEAMWERHTAGTYSHWNKHLTRLERESFYREVAQIMTEAMNGK